MSSAIYRDLHCSPHAGHDLPLNAQLFKYSSWMGGDRDGNPSVTSLVTAHVVYLARWMAADLYLKEVDALHFEVSHVVRPGLAQEGTLTPSLFTTVASYFMRVNAKGGHSGIALPVLCLELLL